MIAYLKGLGYKFTENETLNNREFNLVSEVIDVDEENSVFSNKRTLTTYVYDLFLSTRSYSTETIQGIISGAYDNGDFILDASASVEQQERGYLINLTFIKGDL